MSKSTIDSFFNELDSALDRVFMTALLFKQCPKLLTTSPLDIFVVQGWTDIIWKAIRKDQEDVIRVNCSPDAASNEKKQTMRRNESEMPELPAESGPTHEL